MSNVYTLKDIKDRGHRLGSTYEQELKKKIRSVIKFNFEINDFSRKLSHFERQCELEAKYTTKIQSLKSEIKTLKRKETLAQKASSADKIQILSLETKVCELEESLRFELEHAKKNRNLKEYTIECMEKGIESSNNIFKQEIDILSSR
ncbi:hypothetical protein C1646_753315 [Rhizophagus diaphanus]|nr:hypothetical protein C1646_753315 [Rhizophagus diaphanus] [Rhizophagus sp. MUCL 43196]